MDEQTDTVSGTELARRVEREGYTADTWHALEGSDDYVEVRKPGDETVRFDYRGDGGGRDIVGTRPTDSREGTLSVSGEASGAGVKTVKVMLSEDEEETLREAHGPEEKEAHDPPYSFSPEEEAFGTFVTLVYGIERGEFDAYTEEADRLARRTEGARKVEGTESPMYEYPTFNIDFLPDKDEVRVGMHVLSTPRYLQDRLWDYFPEDKLDQIEIRGTGENQRMSLGSDLFENG